MNSPSRTNQELSEAISALQKRIQELEHSEAERKRAEQERVILAEIGRVIGSTLDIETVYERFASIARRLIPFDTISVNLADVPQNLFRVAYSSGLELPGRMKGHEVPIAGSMSGYVMRTRKALVLVASSVEEATRLYPEITRVLSIQAGFHSNMLIPLFSNDAMIGVLHFRAKKHNAYSEADLRLAERIGMQIAGAVANARLFNDLSKTEKALRESNEVFSLFMRHSPIYVFIKEVTPTRSTVLRASENYRQMIGIPGSEMAGKTMEELFPTEFAARMTADDWAVVSGGDVLRLEEELDGRSYATIKFPITRGDKTLLAGYSIDITEQKRAETALRESEERHRRIVEASSDAFLLCSQGAVIYANPAALKLFRADHPEDLIGKRYLDLVHPDDRALSAERVKRNIDENWVASPREHRILALDGQVVHVESIGVPVQYRGETQVSGVFRDITERKLLEAERLSLEERLHRSEKMEALGQLAGGVAHDLNNVLGILSGYSELLLEEIPAGHRSRRHVEKILQSTEKGAAIIQDLLTLARRGVAVSEVVDLNDVVSGFLMTPVFEKMRGFHPRVTFRTECDPNLLTIKGSPVHLEKTLMNLVSNAMEAISDRGEVTIRTQGRYLDKPLRGYDEIQEGDYAVLTVSDTGMGIPAEDREKIFEPFYTKKTMGRSGTGLGLTIVWGTVMDHEGYIDVQTEVGEGTAFMLYFPVTREEPLAPQQKESIERYMGKGESVLVVDDIAEQREVASSLLTRLGYEVHAVSSGAAAADYLKGNKADILVLDMIMAPGIDGLETYRRVLDINPQQKAILVSGFSETDRVREAQELGAGAYVKKPYVMEKIGVAIRDELLKVHAQG
jgi:PAS domain S-box-containing protein